MRAVPAGAWARVGSFARLGRLPALFALSALLGIPPFANAAIAVKKNADVPAANPAIPLYGP